MYFSQRYQTNWYDTNPYGFVSPSKIMVYLQETASRQCRNSGMDLDVLFHTQHKGFLLSRFRMWMSQPLRAYEDIEVQTWCPPSRGLTFLRCYRLCKDGVAILEAHSTWALVDATTKSLLKVSDFDGSFPMDAPVDEAPLPKPVRLSASLPMEPVGQRTIALSDVDFNMHMNNTHYPDMVCDFLPQTAWEGRYLTHMSLSYMKEAALGETLSVHRLPVPDSEDAWWFRLNAPDGRVYFEADMRFGRA